MRVVAGLAAVGWVHAPARAQVIEGVDVKVTLDNNNVDGGHDAVTPGFDGRNLEQNETCVAISPVDPNIVAVANNDFRHVISFDDFYTWLSLNVSQDGGASWFNTYPPGFLADTSAAGFASPLKGLAVASDPVVRFDAAGNLYLAGIAATSFIDEPGGLDSLAYLVRYDYTPGTPGGVSTPNSAANPPNFTYAFTSVVDRSSSQSRPPLSILGRDNDKEWLAIDTNSSSPGFGNIYYTFTRFTAAGNHPIVCCRSTDGGRNFSEPVPITQRGQDGTVFTQGSNIAVASDGTVYVGYLSAKLQDDPSTDRIQVARSDDLGRHFRAPVTVAFRYYIPFHPDGLAFRVHSFPSIAVDGTNPSVLYVAYQALSGDPANGDIFVARSTNRGVTWEAPVRVNDDDTSKHQFFPTIAVSNGALHIAWYDFRDSPNPDDPALTNDVLNVYYASSNTTGFPYPAFSPNVKVSDVGQQPNCRQHRTLGTEAFLGDYIELAARFDGTDHIVHLAWADNRDIPADKCDLDSEPGPFDDPAVPSFPFAFTGGNNQNIYADRLIVAP